MFILLLKVLLGAKFQVDSYPAFLPALSSKSQDFTGNAIFVKPSILFLAPSTYPIFKLHPKSFCQFANSEGAVPD
jgi:hypothetical protein